MLQAFAQRANQFFYTRLRVLNHVSGRDSPGASEEALPAGTDAVRLQRERAQQVKTARRVPEGSHACESRVQPLS